MAQAAELIAAADLHDPRRWLRSTPLLDLDDPQLRLRVHALTQLAAAPRERALALHGFVRRLPLAHRFRLQARTARAVLDAGRGDAADKATLLVAMLRIAGVPARIRYVLLSGEILRGVTSAIREARRPLVEAWLDDRWVRTDTYIFDGACMAAARQRLKDLGWEWGYGIHVSGATVWNGREDAYLGGVPTECDLMVLRDQGVFHDPAQYHASAACGTGHARALRLLHRNLLSPWIDLAWRRLRRQAAPGGMRLNESS